MGIYHNLCFIAEIRKIMYIPANPISYIKVGFEGSKLHGHVFVMANYNQLMY